MTPLEEAQARRIAQLEAELTEALTALQALTTVAEMSSATLAAAVVQITKGAPSLGLARDLAHVAPPTDADADADAVIVPFAVPTRRSTPAAASAEVDQTAPTI